MVLLDPQLQAALIAVPIVALVAGVTPCVQTAQHGLQSSRASHLFLRAEGQERANFQGVDGTTEAQRFQVSLPGSGRARTGILGEGGEALPTQACSWWCEHQQRTT